MARRASRRMTLHRAAMSDPKQQHQQQPSLL
jgi:hypothetical protein